MNKLLLTVNILLISILIGGCTQKEGGLSIEETEGNKQTDAGVNNESDNASKKDTNKIQDATDNDISEGDDDIIEEDDSYSGLQDDNDDDVANEDVDNSQSEDDIDSDNDTSPTDSADVVSDDDVEDDKAIDPSKCSAEENCCKLETIAACLNAECPDVSGEMIVGKSGFACATDYSCPDGMLSLIVRRSIDGERECICLTDCQRYGEIYYPCNRTREFCIDEEKIAKGHTYCNPSDLSCVECYWNGHCKKGEYCDVSAHQCKKGTNPNPPYFPCVTDEDCWQNKEAANYVLYYCLVEKGHCVECVSHCPTMDTECDMDTHQCYTPASPQCDPPCPDGEGWYCWDDGVKTWCRQEGGYCEDCCESDKCPIKKECINADSVCYAPMGVPEEIGGYCFRKCSSDADCKEFDEPDKPSVCYQGVCLCGWM